MIELFSNFFLKDVFEEAPNINSDNVGISINKENYRDCVDPSLEAYKSLRKVIITFDSPDVINNFLTLMSYKVCHMKRVSEIEDMLVINDCVFLN